MNIDNILQEMRRMSKLERALTKPEQIMINNCFFNTRVKGNTINMSVFRQHYDIQTPTAMHSIYNLKALSKPNGVTRTKWTFPAQPVITIPFDLEAVKKVLRELPAYCTKPTGSKDWHLISYEVYLRTSEVVSLPELKAVSRDI